MPARLTPSPLAAARDPLSELRLRGWVLAGLQPLAGLLLDLGSAPPGWPARLRPWLDGVAEVRRHGDLLLVLFATPRALDCAALGPCRGVARRFGVLAAAPVAEPEPALAARLRDHLVLLRAGVPVALPLAAFAPVDTTGWWSLDGFDILPGRAVPGAAAPRAPRRTIAPSVERDPEPVFAGLRAAMQHAPRRRLRFAVGDLAFRLAGALAGAIAGAYAALRWLALAATALTVLIALAMFAAALLSPGPVAVPAPPTGDGTGWPAPLWLIVPAAIALGRDSRRGGAAGGSGSGSGCGGTGAAVAEKPPPLWRRIGAWMAWHSPVGAAVRRRFAERVREIERLFGAGRLDEALRKALKLGGGSAAPGVFGDLPLTGPGLRASLALDLSGRPVTARPMLQPGDQERLAALYRLHAQALARAGDAERGAFILAELLDAPAEAARLLADGGQLLLAARLGEARRLAPAVVIPLWYRAGDAPRALALAARHDLFAELWKELRPGDPFRAALAEAWCARLAAAGDFGRAAGLSRDIATLAEARRGWILRAVEAADPPSPADLARALVALDWRPEPSDPVFDRLRALLDAPGAAGAALRLAVAIPLADRAFEPRRPDAMPPFRLATHGLVRRLVADQGRHGHDDRRAEAMSALAAEGGHHALRHDLRRLARVPKPKEAEPDRRIAIEAGPALAAIVDAVPVAGGGLLVAYASGLLVLRGAGGRERWRGQASGVIGLVPVGAGHSVLVLRRGYGELVGAVFSVGERRLDARGALPVVAWHPRATETGWLVFTDDGAFALLDTAGLLAAPSSLDAAPAPLLHHWSIPMGEPGQPLALMRDAREAALAYVRADGLVEWWTVDLHTLKVDCRLWSGPEPAPAPDGGQGTVPPEVPPEAPPAVLIGLGTHASVYAVAGPGPQPPRDGGAPGWVLQSRKHTLAAPDRAGELQMLAELSAGRTERFAAPCVPLEGPGEGAARAVAGGAVWVGRASSSGSSWTVESHAAGAIRAHFSGDGATAVVFDDLGRLVVLDFAGGERRLVSG